MIFQHSRFQIWNSNQHPFRHDLTDFLYSNGSLPGITTVPAALDYIVAVLYPQSKSAVATVAALPTLGNAINDFRVVNDDGDGKAAGYRWEQREGEVSPSWHKIYDLDWGVDSIIQQMHLKTQDVYASKRGYDDRDAAGNLVTGTLAGQSIYGGATANHNLTLFANSGDGVGPTTGYVQFGDNVRPISNNVYSLGTTSERFLKAWTSEVQAGTLNLASGSITDSSGTISFLDENLSTTGNVTGGAFITGSLTVDDGSIVDTDGLINFGATDLTTSGTVTAGDVQATGAPSAFDSGTTIGNLTFSDDTIESASDLINFVNGSLTTTGGVTAGDGSFTKLNVDSVEIDGNSIVITAANTNLNLTANGTGVVNVTSAMTTLGQTVTGTLSVTGQLNADNLRLDGNVLSATNVNGSITLTPNGSGTVISSASITAGAGSLNLGTSGQPWLDLYLSGAISNGTNQITMGDLLSLRSVTYRDSARTQPAQAGDALFYDGSQWLASVPDSEIAHSSLSGLTTSDAGHTQFVMLAGRSGGQTIQGGTAASENLILESTAHATKGTIRVKDTVYSFTDASYSGSWAGADLGGASNRFRHVYTAGEFFGLRLENVGALPSASTQNYGRLVYLTTTGDVYVDRGTAFQRLNYNRFESDTSWNGSDTTKNVTVSDVDATKAIWQLKDNTNDYEIIYCSIKATSTTNVLITVGSALPAGSYRLVGLE